MRKLFVRRSEEVAEFSCRFQTLGYKGISALLLSFILFSVVTLLVIIQTCICYTLIRKTFRFIRNIYMLVDQCTIIWPLGRMWFKRYIILDKSSVHYALMNYKQGFQNQISSWTNQATSSLVQPIHLVHTGSQGQPVQCPFSDRYSGWSGSIQTTLITRLLALKIQLLSESRQTFQFQTFSKFTG